MQFSEIKGFGEKRIRYMKEAGFDSPADLITYFPTRYIDTANLSDLYKAEEGERVVILACTQEKPKAVYPRRGLSIVKVKFTYDGKTVWASWFNQPFMAKNIVPNRYYYIAGKLKKYKSVYEITGPQLIRFTGEEPPVIPVYKSIGKIGSTLISDAIKSALKMLSVDGYIPNDIASKYSLSSVNEAFNKIHFPRTISDVNDARYTLETERLSYMLCAYSIIREREGNARVHFYKDNGKLLKEAIESLPFVLTESQLKAVRTIFKTMNSPTRLNALLEGDVGCGKTIVAFLAMLHASKSGYQSAMIAPTEILALQHYRKAVEFFEKFGLKCAYLSGSLTKAEREKAIQSISSGEAKCVFGTHALIYDEVEFNDLSLVITDEQHRFGVAQRARLENKTKGADSIVMSATPIPRTLALTLYGDLLSIIIDGVPSKKAKTETRFVPKDKEKGMWSYVRAQAEYGGQTFVVAPRISDDEDGISAESLYEEHKKELGDKVALLHGKQKDGVKNATMQAFADGKIKVLVATTVVEVGIDVPNATSMIIYDADRFGLSQLHQLRGRVGRGTKDSYCFVLTSTTNPETEERINKFISTSNGFELAEYDFANRGAGDFLGYNQHGNAGALTTDPNYIAHCKTISKEMLERNSCREKIKKSLAQNASDYFSEIALN